MNWAVRPVHGPRSLARWGVLGVTKIGARNVGYWISAVAEGEEDYYSKPGEEPGKWAGSLARELRLEGEVDHDDYMAIFAGKSPRDGGTLVRRPEPRRWVDASGRNRKADPVLGFDLRFSAPKSASLLWAVGPPEVRAAVARAHERAVEAGLAYLERNACWVQRGAGGARLERGTGFVGMGFLHRSSRAGDPQLHTHMLISNMTRAASDGRWLSLAAPKGRMPLWLQAKTAGYLYQAVFRGEMTQETGLEWGEVTNGYADLAGFDRSLIDHFSQRRAEIVERMAELGLSSAAAAEVAAYRTRAEKDYGVAVDDQRADWIARAAEFSLTPDSIGRTVAAARSRQPAALGTEHLEAAIADLEAHHSHFDRRDLICAAAAQLREGGDALGIEQAVDGLLEEGRLVCVHRGEEVQLAPSYYTTPRLWAMEQRIIEAACAGEGAGAATIDRTTLEAVLARHRYLGAEQAEMVRRLTTGGERVICVAALPGTGKTTALLAAREAWAAGGIRGIGVATARSASGELKQAGVPSTSIADLLIRTAERVERGLEPLPPGAVIVVDEASAMSTPHAAALLDLVERCQGKLVLIGDPHQIGAVGPGGIYGHLTGRVELIALREIRRQRDPVDREIVRLAHEGRGSDALDLLDASERLRIADTHPEALDALALDWHRSFAQGTDAVMIARRNTDVEALNERARQFRRECGELGEGIRVAGSEFNVGDRVMTRVNTPEVSNRERWEVAGVDCAKRTITLRRLNENAGAVLERGYLDRKTPDGQPAIQHAYAITTYAAQSKTFERSYVMLDPGISREDFVVAVSRSRGDTVAYGVAAGELLDADLGPGKREIEDPLHELRFGSERVASEYAASEVGDRKELEKLGTAELARRRVELEQRLAKIGAPSPVAERLAALQKRIETGEARLAELRSQWVQAKDAGVGEAELRRLEGLGRQGRGRLDRLETERAELAAIVAAEPPPSLATPPERYELKLVEDRIVVQTRKEAARERYETSEMIVAALGPRPAGRHKAFVWDEGVDLIHGFRQRHGITSTEGDPLGPRSGEASRRRERNDAQQRLARIQQRLAVERQRAVERALEIEA